jgi:hypothetical protein
MSRAECPREQEILDAIASSRWPGRLGEDLAQHVDGCAFCKDLGLVADALNADFSSSIEQARIPTAGLVWWRAELRARQDSVRAASRPIALAHYVAVGSAAVIAIALLVLIDFGTLGTLSLASLIPESLPVSLIFGTLGALAILASVALYVVLSDE